MGAIKSPECQRIVIIIQARMSATRLPGKPMKILAGKPLLSYLTERVKRAELADQIVIATSRALADREIVNFCKAAQLSVFVGSEENVLERYYQAAKQFQAEVIVRITGDCPLIDPAVIDDVIQVYLKNYPHYDYVSNMLKPSYPRGMDVEVFSLKVLKKAACEASKPEEREHVTLYIYEHPEIFSLKNVEYSKDISHYRWTVDTEEDFRLIDKLISTLYPINPHFTIADLQEQMESHRDWFFINAHIKQKPLRL